MSKGIDNFFVGSYNYSLWSQTANGEGISICELDTNTGKMRLINSYGNIKNPSYLAITNNKLFVIEETPQDLEPQLCSFLIKKDSLLLLKARALSGSAACHISINNAQTKLAVSNYSSGSLDLFRLKHSAIAKKYLQIKHIGQSINPQRQEASHIHSSVFSANGQFLFVADLGIDQVVVYKLNDSKTQKLKLVAGSGPRHLLWHNNNKHLFVINELNNTISLCLFENETLKIINTVSTLTTSKKESYAAAIKIHPNGKYLYASNRGEDIIAVFSFNEQTQSLELIQSISSQGKFPRDLELSKDGKILLVANQQSDSIYSYFINNETGLLTKTEHSLSLGTPVCIIF